MCFIAGCQEPPAPGTMPQTEKPFAGLEQIIEDNGPIRMLLIHGMSDHSPDWGLTYLQPYATNLRANIGAGGKLYSLTPASFPGNEFLKAHKNLTDDYAATLQQFPITRGGKTIIEAYVLTWSPLTRPFKAARFTEDDTLPRLTINAAAKTFVNQVLSDVVLYLAGYDDHVLEDSVCAAVDIFDTHGLGDDGIQSPKAPIVLLSESEGSIMLFDAILGELPYDKASQVRRFDGTHWHREMLRNTKLFIMNANQLPLLDASTNVTYGDLTAAEISEPMGGPPSFSYKYLKAIGKLRHSETPDVGQSEKPMDLLVLTDFNDDLSYYLDEQDAPSEIQVINLKPVNGAHYGIPLKFPNLVENPIIAHTGYSSNADVATAIVNERASN
jgi:hypothetical protein